MADSVNSGDIEGCAQAAEPPPSCNTGVNYLASDETVPKKWFLDWLRVSFEDKHLPWLVEVFRLAGYWPRSTRGRHGYDRALSFFADYLDEGSPVFEVWTGGDSQGGRSTLDVHPASAIRDVLTHLVQLSRGGVEFFCTRLDLAMDFDGWTYAAAEAEVLALYTAWPYEGRKPGMMKHDDMGSGLGCTLYVGTRTSPCFLRLYEKGKQMRDASRPHWLRFEFEIKPKDENYRREYWSLIESGQQDLIPQFYNLGVGVHRLLTGELVERRRIEVVEKIRDFDDRVDVMLYQYGGLIGEMMSRAGGDAEGFMRMMQDGMERLVRKRNIAAEVA